MVLRNLTSWGDAEDTAITFFSAFAQTHGEYYFVAQSEGEAAVKRLLGCLLVQNMPDEGMDDVLESLADSYEFYWRDQLLRLPEPPERLVSAGVVGSVRERPAFELAE